MASDPRIRASDADRDRTAALLREHHAAGRLTADEFMSGLTRHMRPRPWANWTNCWPTCRAIDLYKLPDASLDRGRRGGSGPPPLPWMMAPGRLPRPGGPPWGPGSQ